MKALVLNGSPRADRGDTWRVLLHVVEGMKDAGAEVEVIHLSRLQIKPCLGCFNCWTKTPGECVQKDDMRQVLQKIASSELHVYATPLYVDGMTGTLKNAMDRGLPLLQPFFEVRDDHCRHPLREHVVKNGKAMLVSVSGFTEIDNFEPLIRHMKAICTNMSRQFVGAIVRPAAWILSGAPDQEPMQDIYAALKEAGRQAVTQGTLSPGTLETIAREIIPREMAMEFANSSFRRALKKIAG